MSLELYWNKSLEENASLYFEKAKKAKKKLIGLALAVAETKKKLQKVESEAEETKKAKENKSQKVQAPKEWYEKLRWFISSEGLLVIGGRDATTNEIVIKKYTDKEDTVFHTEAPGSPFVVIKGKPGEATLQEAAAFCAANSRAWERRLGTAEVYAIKGEQVSKTAQPGEYLAKGAFMIYGKRQYFHPELKIAVGVTKEGKLMAAPPTAAQKHCAAYLLIKPGDLKKSDLAKRVKHELEKRSGQAIELDTIMAALPPGEGQIVKER